MTALALILFAVASPLLDLQQNAVPPKPWEVTVKTGTAKTTIVNLDGVRGICLDSNAASFSIQRRSLSDELAIHPFARARVHCIDSVRRRLRAKHGQ